MRSEIINEDMRLFEPLKDRDLRCPACGYRGCVFSEVTISCFLNQEPNRLVEAEWAEPPGYWGGESPGSCGECGHDGMVADFVTGRPTSGLLWYEVDPGESWVGCRSALPPLSGFTFEVYREGATWVAHSIRPRTLRMEEIHLSIDAARVACARAASQILDQDERSLSRAVE